MSRIGALVRACHPEPTLAVTTLTAALAAAAGRGVAGTAAVGAALLAGQLSVGWSNDYVDRERDLAVARADKPLVRGDLPPRFLGAAALTALVLAVPLSLLSGVPSAAAHLTGVASAWAYNLRLKATVVSVLPYVVAFGLLPAVVTLGLPGRPWPPAWAMGAGALLGAGAHFANTLPDLEDDARTGVLGLPHRLGRARSTAAAAACLFAATLLLTFGPAEGASALALVGLAVAVAVLVAGVLLGRRPGSRAAFRATLVVAAVDVVLLLARGGSLA